jgi:hypothetical protein
MELSTEKNIFQNIGAGGSISQKKLKSILSNIGMKDP